MPEQEQKLLKVTEHSTGQLPREQFVAEVMANREGEGKQIAVEAALDKYLAEWPDVNDYCVAASQVGKTLYHEGYLDLATNAYDFAFQEESPWHPDTPINAGNFVDSLSRYFAEVMVKERKPEDKDWFTSKRSGLALARACLAHSRDYLCYQEAYDHPESKREDGSIYWINEERRDQAVIFEDRIKKSEFLLGVIKLAQAQALESDPSA